jgi:hypothetical protein
MLSVLACGWPQMLHMVALVGPKPRDVLNDNRSDQSRWRVLKNVLAAVHGLTTQDLLHVHTLGSSWTKLSFTLFLLKAVNTHGGYRCSCVHNLMCAASPTPKCGDFFPLDACK